MEIISPINWSSLGFISQKIHNKGILDPDWNKAKSTKQWEKKVACKKYTLICRIVPVCDNGKTQYEDFNPETSGHYRIQLFEYSYDPWSDSDSVTDKIYFIANKEEAIDLFKSKKKLNKILKGA